MLLDGARDHLVLLTLMYKRPFYVPYSCSPETPIPSIRQDWPRMKGQPSSHPRNHLPLIRSQLFFLPPSCPNFPSPFLPLHPAPQPHLLVPDELPNHPRPALVTWQIGIELLGHLMQCRQPCPRNSGEIVMLVMQAHVVRQKIQRPIIRERL